VNDPLQIFFLGLISLCLLGLGIYLIFTLAKTDLIDRGSKLRLGLTIVGLVLTMVGFLLSVFLFLILIIPWPRFTTLDGLLFPRVKDYSASQSLSRYIQRVGFDGFVHPSALRFVSDRKANNLALFGAPLSRHRCSAGPARTFSVTDNSAQC
jgi:hypothetical protein